MCLLLHASWLLTWIFLLLVLLLLVLPLPQLQLFLTTSSASGKFCAESDPFHQVRFVVDTVKIKEVRWRVISVAVVAKLESMMDAITC